MVNMSVAISVLLFIVGICVGSFINVLVGRFDDEDRFWYRGRSVCDHCGRQLKWWENIPLVSYLFLGGKCRSCRSPIPYQYPLVEIGMGILFLIPNSKILISKHQSFLLFTIYLLLITFLIIVTLFDLKYLLIPDRAILALSFLALVFNFLKITNYQLLITNYLLTAVFSSLFLLILHLITRGKGMGLGDVKFAFFMGLFLGWPRIIVGFYLAFLTGAIIGVILILMGRKKFGQLVPFGPFLVLGTFISWFWGSELINLFFQWTKTIAVYL